MSHNMTLTLACLDLPSWAGLSTWTTCIEAQSRNRHENMAASYIERYPFSFPLFSISKITLRWQTTLQEASFAQHIGNRARTVVARIKMICMTPTPFVRLPLQSIPCGDCTFYSIRGISRGIGESIFDQSGPTIFETVGDRLPRLYLIGAGN